MNVPNNKRKKESQEKIEKVFIEMIQSKNLNEINITDIVKRAKINRSTFYANYIDIYDLRDKVVEKMYHDFIMLYPKEVNERKHSYNFLPMFKDIKENQIFYKTLFKLEFDFSIYFRSELENDEMIRFYGTTDNLDYHIAFFSAGINAIIRKWIDTGCIESPEEMANILKDEYKEKASAQKALADNTSL